MHNNRRRRSDSDDGEKNKVVRRGSAALESDLAPANNDFQKFHNFIHRILFPNLPEQYPFRKKLQISKNTTRIGLAYDLSQDFCSVLMCAVFVASTYYKSFEAVHMIYFMDMSISLYVLVDILFNMYLIGKVFLMDIRCIVDSLSIFPTLFITIYVVILGQKLSFFYTQLISTLRLIRVIRIFKTLRFFHSMRKAVLKLVMTLSCFIFICSGLFQFFENDMGQDDYSCQFITEDTNWRPSCSEVMPADDMTSCDCHDYNCEALYDIIDPRGRPSQIRCQLLDFNDAIYFVVITVTLVGYGSSVFTFASKAVLVALIIIALITIPPQLNDVEKYMTAKTSYRSPYHPSAGDYHVIVCGHVNDKKKLSAFLKEFLHPDRMFSSSPQFHVVIMSTAEPSDGVLELLQNQFLEGRITYCMGSALVQKDLERVRADLAFGMFFLCNTELDASNELTEDTATVMRALSVSNFNPATECFVQTLKADDRKILKDSDVDVILCLDEYKVTLQAKNSICPGFSTMIENLFHSFGGISSAVECELDPWYHEYLHGARMELYYVPIDKAFMKYIDFNFAILTEAVYTEWNLTIVGVCTEMQDEVSFNPISKKTKLSDRFGSLAEFYRHFCTAIIIADDNLQAEEVSKGLADSYRYKSILKKMKMAEVVFPIRQHQARKSQKAKPSFKRSSFLLKGMSKARDSLSKQRSRLSGIVRSPRKDSDDEKETDQENDKNRENAVASDVQKLFSEDYDSDNSVDDSSYIGYACTREKELAVAMKAQSESGFSDDGDKGFGQTSMVYTRNRTRLDVYKGGRLHLPDAGEDGKSGGLSILAAIEKNRRRKMQQHSGALQKFSSKALARGRQISLALRRGGGAVVPRPPATSIPDSDPDPVPSATSSPDRPSSPTTSLTAHEVTSNTTTGEVRHTFTLTPSQMASEQLDTFDEEEEEEDDEEEEGADGLSSLVTSSHLDNRCSVSSVVKKRLGTFSITEGDEEDPCLSEEEKEEPMLTSSSAAAPAPSLGKSKLKHSTWGTLRESVVQNSPSQMLQNATCETESSNENSDVSDDEDSAPRTHAAKPMEHVNDVVNVILKGKKITNMTMADMLKGHDRGDALSEEKDEDTGENSSTCPPQAMPKGQGEASSSAEENGLHEQHQPSSTGASGPGSPHSRVSKVPRRSVLRKYVSADNTTTTEPNSVGLGSKLQRSTFSHRKLPPLTTAVEERKKGVSKLGSVSVGPEVGSRAVQGPPSASISAATRMKKNLRIKKLAIKFSRSSRVAVLCEPGAMSPTYSAVKLQLETKSPPKSIQMIASTSSSAKENPDRLLKMKKVVRASVLRKQNTVPSNTPLRPLADRVPSNSNTSSGPPSFPSPPGSLLQKSNSFGGFSSVVKKAILNNHPDSKNGLYGRPSEQVTDTAFLANHIVIFGNVSISHIFISELRRPTVRADAYHPILLIDTEKPKEWDRIVLQYNDVYYLPGSLLRSKGFGKANVEKSFAVILLNMRNELSLNENIDSQTLFSYLKLEQYIPRNVFFSVELSNPANMSVLNATLMRRVRTHGMADTRICLRSHLETIANTESLANATPSRALSAGANAASGPRAASLSSAPSSPLPSALSPLAMSLSGRMVMLSSGSSDSSSSSEDETTTDTAAEELRKQNIAKFRAEMRLKKQESELKSGGFSSGNRKTNRQSIRTVENLPKAAHGSISRVHTRGTVVQSRATLSNFRAPTVDLGDSSNSRERDSEEEEEEWSEERKPGKEEVRKEIVNNDDDFWNATDTHHMLPVFAAARAYVPSTFESLLVQSFFGVLTPMMCEIFVCGQSGQSIVQIDVPAQLHGRTFLDMFRIFSYHQVLCIGLYRAPKEETMSTLPYVYLSPPKTALLFDEDRVYLYGKQSRISRAIAACGTCTWGPT